MKKVITTIITITALLCISSCNKSNEKKEETNEVKELRAFMLGGMYFFHGYGGVSAIESQAKNADNYDQMILDYRDVFVFPFKPEQASDMKTMLSEMWDINDKVALEKTLNTLINDKDSKNPHKAWDYARTVNNACVGFAAGYLTQEEAKVYVEKTLVAAKKDFKTWEDYLKDFNAGRITWDPKSPDKEAFDKVCTEMLANPKGLYQTIKLN